MARDHIETVGGISEFMDYDEKTGDLHVEHVEDVESTVKAVAAEHAATGGKSKSGLMWKIGELPWTVYTAYGRMRGLPDGWIHHPAYRAEVVALCKANPRLSPTGGIV